LLVDALPVLGAAITLLFTDRSANTCIYSGYSSGDPLIWQHLFWYFGHPEVYIIVLPAFGVVSWILGKELIRSLPPHLGMLCATLSLAGIGFFVWAHHMFVAGISSESRVYFSAATMVIAIPTALKLISWLSSALGFNIWSAALSTFTSFLTFFISGGITGLVLSNLGIDIIYHDTYFVVAHFHYVLSIASSISVLLVVRLFLLSLVAVPPELPAKISLVVLVLVLNIVFGPLHVLGIEVHPRRISSAPESSVSIQQVSNGAVIGLAVFSSVFIGSPGSSTSSA
jgi:heme/copper-type cytochrome/quinol oxidase subunit 1